MLVLYVKSVRETQRAARILAGVLGPSRRATVVALQGELGAGKTTFVQGFARALGVREKIKSPTFVLMKIYALKKNRTFKYLAHIDCYRIQNPKDLIHLGLKEILRDRDAAILIEWPDRIKKILPRDTIWLKFSHGATKSERLINV